uniref:Uncharacterized protein n=1 Tax=Phlebotomus papatasi TaxID=29031 RepID=A0A1B0GQ74_PHLPP
MGYLIDDKDQFYKIARQGTSRLLGHLAPARTGQKNNAILTEFSQPKQYPEDDFIFPKGGIIGPGGLCQRSIIIHGSIFADQFRFY